MMMVDIHSHILPNVDDGARDMEETSRILDALYSQGVRTVFATPHYAIHSREDKAERVAKAYEKVKAYVKENYPDMEIWQGGEVYMEQGMLERIKKDDITLNHTSYVLCEFSFTGPYKEMYEYLQQLVRARYKPVIAHVERYTCLQGQWDKIEELRKMGVYMQINAESLSGKLLDRRYRYAKQLLLADAIDFVGSDAHDMKGRAPQMDRAQATLIKLLGTEKAECILYKNAQVFLK